MTLDQPMKAFFDDLGSGAARPWSVLALVATASAALAAAGVHEAFPAGDERADHLGAELETIRKRFEDMLARDAEVEAPGRVSGAEADPGQATVPEPLLDMATQAVRVLEIATRAMGETEGVAAGGRALMVTAIALGRAAVEGAVQNVHVALPVIPDDLDRTALRTRAQGLQQKARRVEADFLQTMLKGSGGG